MINLDLLEEGDILISRDLRWVGYIENRFYLGGVWSPCLVITKTAGGGLTYPIRVSNLAVRKWRLVYHKARGV